MADANDIPAEEKTPGRKPGEAVRGYYFEELIEGLSATHERTISEADIVQFAELSGDFNPVHLDKTYAATTPFKDCIAHGILSASLISAVFGMKLPGPGAIYVSQTLNFKAPVKVGDHVVAEVVVETLVEAKRRAVFSCACYVGDRCVLQGDAVLLVPRRPAE